MPKRTLGIFGVKRSGYLGPFGRHADDLPSGSDSSDSDYTPQNTDINKVTTKTTKSKKRKGNHNIHSDSSSRSIKRVKTSTSVKSTLTHEDNTPTEILVEIFKHLLLDDIGVRHLCRAARVSKQWNNASNFPSLWKVVNLAFLGESRSANDLTIIRLVKRFPDIEELNVNGWKKITDKALKAIANTLKNLTGLYLGNCLDMKGAKSKITSGMLRSLARQFSLQKIDFSTLLTDASILKDILEKGKREMTVISLADCKCIGAGQLNLIQSNCCNLKTLDLTKTSLESINIERLQAGCPNLEELFLTNLNLRLLSSTREEIESSKGFPRLRILSLGSLSGGVFVTDNFLKRMLHASRKLKILDLRGCTKVSSEGLLDLPINALERLFMGRCTVDREMLYAISPMWQDSLRELDFSRTSLTDIVPNWRANDIEFGKLTTVDLCGSLVTDYDVSYLLDRCESITHLDLTLCRGISRGMKTVHDIDSIRKLKKTLANWRHR